MSTKLWTDRSAVYVVTVGAEFVPVSPWDFPATFSDARLESKNLALDLKQVNPSR